MDDAGNPKSIHIGTAGTPWMEADNAPWNPCYYSPSVAYTCAATSEYAKARRFCACYLCSAGQKRSGSSCVQCEAGKYGDVLDATACKEYVFQLPTKRRYSIISHYSRTAAAQAKAVPRVQLLRLLVKVLSELVIAFVSTTKVSYTCFPGPLFFLLQ